LKKLEYMDELMGGLSARTPQNTSTEHVDPLSSLRKTLRRHYEAKRAHYGVAHPDFYDRDLRRLFSDSPAHAHQPTAASFLSRIRREISSQPTGYRFLSMGMVLITSSGPGRAGAPQRTARLPATAPSWPRRWRLWFDKGLAGLDTGSR
jgi:hypothetical protein